jgi:hypothetical protein
MRQILEANAMRTTLAHSLLPVAIMSALIGEAAASPVVGPLVGVGEAEHLVMAELIHEHRSKLPGLVISSEPHQNSYLPSFWILSVDWDERVNGEQYGTGHFGYFAVDKMTGDVWSAVNCDPYQSPELARAQRQLRRRLGMTAQDYKRLRHDGPYCGCKEPPVLGPCP